MFEVVIQIGETDILVNPYIFLIPGVALFATACKCFYKVSSEISQSIRMEISILHPALIQAQIWLLMLEQLLNLNTFYLLYPTIRKSCMILKVLMFAPGFSF